MEEEYVTQLFEDIDLHTEDIYVMQQELKKMVPQHTHSQGHILVVLEGAATVNVEYSEYYIPNGYFVWIPPCVSHRISFEEHSIKLINIYYPKTFSVQPFYQVVGVYPIPSILYHTIECVLGKTKAYLETDWQHELLSTVHHILPYIILDKKFQLRLPTTDHPIVLKIVEAIHQQYQGKLTIENIGSEIGLSVRTISRYLRKELDVSFIEYVRTYRVIMAIKQIVKDEDSISNIAYNVGYESLTAFSNAFYKVTGCRPSQFLNKNSL